MLYNKRGELTSQQIVVYSVLIISFVVILIWIILLNLGGTTKEEICHNSVLMKGESPIKSVFSLDCHTKYICLSQTSKCDAMLSKPEEIIQVKTEDDVYKALAENMANCWWMFGEGQIDYVGSDFLSTGLYCSICSQIAFDSSVKKIFNGDETFSQRGLYDYIVSHKYTKDQKYDQYMYGLNFSNTDQILQYYQLNGFMEVNMNNYNLVLMGITSTRSWIGNAVIYGGSSRNSSSCGSYTWCRFRRCGHNWWSPFKNFSIKDCCRNCSDFWRV